MPDLLSPPDHRPRMSDMHAKQGINPVVSGGNRSARCPDSPVQYRLPPPVLVLYAPPHPYGAFPHLRLDQSVLSGCESTAGLLQSGGRSRIASSSGYFSSTHCGQLLLFPVSWWSFEFGLVWPEDSLYLLPLWIGGGLLLGVNALVRRHRHNRTSSRRSTTKTESCKQRRSTT